MTYHKFQSAQLYHHVKSLNNKSETALPDVLPKWSVDGPVLPLGVRPCPSVQSRSSVLDCVQPQSPLSKVHVAAIVDKLKIIKGGLNYVIDTGQNI